MNTLKTIVLATALSLSATVANAGVIISVPVVVQPEPIYQPQMIWVQLPNGQYVQEYMQQSMVYGQPTIVAGGFYWYHGHRYYPRHR
jgi:hypothetical protein